MRVEVFPTSLISKSNERAALVIITNDYKIPIKFWANGEERIASPWKSRHLITTNGDLHLKFETGEEYNFKVNFNTPKRFKVYIAPTVHTDWGYTDVQYNVERLYKENCDKILNFGKNDIKFNVEVIYQCPKDKLEQLEELNQKGIIGIQGFPLNVLTGLCNHEEIIRLFYPARDLRRQGFKVLVAALNDIPSAVWTLPSILTGSDIPYFVLASNPDRGPLHMIGSFESPVYWVGPDGSRVLAWFSGGYKGLMPGFHGYHQGHSAGLLSDLKEAEAGIAQFLHYFETRGYPYEEVLMYGMFIDNFRVSDKYAKIVEEFNNKWDNPTLYLITTDEFFEIVRRKGNNLPEVVGDLGSYWEDGAASTARELSLSRRAKKLLYFAEVAYTMDYLRGAQYPQDMINEIWNNIVYFDEHTWGDAASISDPYSFRQMEQWRIKGSYAINAFNTAVKLTYGEWISNPYPYKISGVINNTFYELEPMSSKPLITKELHKIPINDTYETPYYIIKIRGNVLSHIVDKELGKDIISNSEFNKLVYVLGGKGTKMERTILNYYYEGSPTEPVYTIYEETNPEFLGAWENDDVLVLKFRAKAYLSEITKTITFVKRKKEILIDNEIDKPDILDKEGVYILFNFDVNKPEVFMELPGVFMNVNKEQVKGACSEWFSVNNIALLKSSDMDIAIYSEDAPLFTIDDVFKGLWRSQLTLTTGKIYSYIMNNYWHTNYKASQGGKFNFRYMITSGKGLKPSKAYNFFLTPFAGRIIEGDITIEPPNIIVTTIKKWDLGEGIIIRLLEPDNEQKSVRIRSNMLKGYHVYITNLLEEEKASLGKFNGEIEINIKPRSYITLLFKKE